MSIIPAEIVSSMTVTTIGKQYLPHYSQLVSQRMPVDIYSTLGIVLALFDVSRHSFISLYHVAKILYQLLSISALFLSSARVCPDAMNFTSS